MSLMRNIARSYRAPGEVVTGLARGDLREPQVLFFALLACGLIFVAQWPGLSRAAVVDPSVTFEQRMGATLFAVMFILPLLLYGLAGLLQLGVKLYHPVAGLHVRLAFFWSLLAVTPLMLLQGGLSAMLGPQDSLRAFQFVVFGVFLYMVGAGLRAVLRLTQGAVRADPEQEG
ncbi:MAG: YIP1 family protein [Roseinatronobacter sp.]